MVVCKCRKATKLYCFVHKTPLCLDCVCSSEHALCVVGQYSDWVNDGDYDWPPKCPLCTQSLEESETAATRLGCLHVLHSACLEGHLSSFPPYTAPAGYTCPLCTDSMWPPKTQKDAATTLYTLLRAVISRSSASGVLLGGASSPPLEQPSLPALASAPTHSAATTGNGSGGAGSEGDGGEMAGASRGGSGAGADVQEARGVGVGAGVEAIPVTVDSGPADLSLPSPTSPRFKMQKKASGQPTHSPLPPGALPRKPSHRAGEKMAIDIQEEYGYGHDNTYTDDEDGNKRKYVRRGPFYTQLLRQLGSFWAPPQYSLPVTMRPKDRAERESLMAEELVEGRPRRRAQGGRRAGMEGRKILLGVAIASCMATMIVLYFRLAQTVVVGRQGQGGAAP